MDLDVLEMRLLDRARALDSREQRAAEKEEVVRLQEEKAEAVRRGHEDRGCRYVDAERLLTERSGRLADRERCLSDERSALLVQEREVGLREAELKEAGRRLEERMLELVAREAALAERLDKQAEQEAEHCEERLEAGLGRRTSAVSSEQGPEARNTISARKEGYQEEATVRKRLTARKRISAGPSANVRDLEHCTPPGMSPLPRTLPMEGECSAGCQELQLQLQHSPRKQERAGEGL